MATIVRDSGGSVPDYLLKLKKASRQEKRRLARSAVDRQDINNQLPLKKPSGFQYGFSKGKKRARSDKDSEKDSKKHKIDNSTLQKKQKRGKNVKKRKTVDPREED